MTVKLQYFDLDTFDVQRQLEDCVRPRPQRVPWPLRWLFRRLVAWAERWKWLGPADYLEKCVRFDAREAIAADGLEDEIKRQIDALLHRREAPWAIVMGPRQLMSFREETHRFHRGYAGEFSGLYRKNVSVADAQMLNAPPGRIENYVERELAGFERVSRRQDPMRRCTVFHGELFMGLPIAVLPWLDGVLVLPHFAEPNAR